MIITKDDVISRQAAIDRINKQREHLEPNIFPQDKIGDAAYRICAEFIERLPSAQRKGKWIATQEWGGRNYSCSCCKFSFMVDTCMYEPMWNFCPNCGAEMTKGEEDERIKNS